MFTPAHFFELSHFAHHALFDPTQPVWEVLTRLHAYLLSQQLGAKSGTIEAGAYLVHPELITIGEGSHVEAGAYIVGPCWIGKRCQVRHGAYIRGDVLTGDECVIGHATEVKNALFLNKAQAGHFAYVGDSILGNHVNLGAGTKCANLRFDRKNVVIGKEKIATNLRKFGAIFGDEAQTGCNCVTNPGTLLERGSFVRPCESVSGLVKGRKLVKA